MLVAKEKAQIDDNNWNGRAMWIHKDGWGFQAIVAKKEVRRWCLATQVRQDVYDNSHNGCVIQKNKGENKYLMEMVEKENRQQ